MSGSSRQLRILRERFDNRCHYCDRQCNNNPGSAGQGTREHVVPKTYGGANALSNYVFACANCNNKRGNQLFYCECDWFCGPLIRKALSSDDFVRIIFDGLIKHNTPKVYKNGDGVWTTRIYHGSRHWDSWAEAMEFALSHQFERKE